MGRVLMVAALLIIGSCTFNLNTGSNYHCPKWALELLEKANDKGDISKQDGVVNTSVSVDELSAVGC